MGKIRWGVLSTGSIARDFARDFGHVTNGELVAVASRTAESAASFAETYQIPRVHGSYRDLFDDPDVDAVYVATPHTLHFQNTVDAFSAGKAVLCEKPLTTTPEECRSLVEHAERTGCYLMEAMWTYFLPAIQKAKEWVDEGRIGEIKHIKADFGYHFPFDPERRAYKAELAGGCLLDMGIYPIALTWLFLKEDPQVVDVIAESAPNGVEDDVVMLFNYSGAVATLATSFQCKLQNWAYIIGREGYVAIPDFWKARECYLFAGDSEIDHFEDGRQSLGLNFETEAVNQDLLSGKTQSETVTWADSLKFQEHMALVRAAI